MICDKLLIFDDGIFLKVYLDEGLFYDILFCGMVSKFFVLVFWYE